MRNLLESWPLKMNSNTFRGGQGGSVRWVSNWKSGGCGFDPRWQYSFTEIDHEIFSKVILPLPLNQEGQLSVSGKRMCRSTGYQLRGLSLPRKKCG